METNIFQPERHREEADRVEGGKQYPIAASRVLDRVLCNDRPVKVVQVPSDFY